eukprot:5609900-Prymnesium_polylepis.2
MAAAAMPRESWHVDGTTLPYAEQFWDELWRAARFRKLWGCAEMGYLKICNTIRSGGAARHNSSSPTTDPVFALRAITRPHPFLRCAP